MQKPIDIYTFMPYTCVYIYTHIHVSCFWSKFVYLHSPAKVAVFSTWQSTYTHSLLTEIKSMLYLVSSSSFRVSVTEMFFNPLVFCGPFSYAPSPPIFFFSTFKVHLCSWFCSDQENIFKGNLVIVLTYAALFHTVSYLGWPQMELPFCIKNQCSNPKEPQLLRGHRVLCIHFSLYRSCTDPLWLLWTSS